MSSLKTEVLLREFHYNGVRIPDPGPELSRASPRPPHSQLPRDCDSVGIWA